MKQAAILCASGIGDGLLMMIAAHHLKKAGYVPTIFHDNAKVLSSLFENYKFLPHLPLKWMEKELEVFDSVIVENDNSKRAWHLFDLRDQGKLSHMTVFFPTPSKKKIKGDYLFNPHLPVASNLGAACQLVLGTPFSKENDISLPKGASYRKYPKRIVIHPTSNDLKRNWTKWKFLKLAALLEKNGYSPVFCISPDERKQWETLDSIEIISFSNLKDVASYIYESGYLIGNDSGLGHLASNIKIPTLTISGNPKRVRLWRPDWTYGKVVTPSLPLPNFKGINLRMRENYWQRCISVGRVFKIFLELAGESSCCLL